MVTFFCILMVFIIFRKRQNQDFHREVRFLKNHAFDVRYHTQLQQKTILVSLYIGNPHDKLKRFGI